MLIDRHRVAALLDLSRIAGSSEAERVASQPALETLLVALYAAATPTARERFTQRIERLPASEKPWGALRRNPSGQLALGPPIPPVVHLVLGQRDDDPDAAEDGNRLPDRDMKAGQPWLPLYAAFDRWDTPVIAAHIGPMGWQLPLTRPTPLDEGLAAEFPPARPILRQLTTSATPQPSAPEPASPQGAPPLAPTPAPASAPASPSSIALPIAAGLGAAALGGALVLAFTRTHTTPEVMP